MAALISLRDVTRTYAIGEVEVPALRGVTLEIAEGEWVAIVGPSGSGKSTLLNLLGCLDRPDSGSYRLAGIDVSSMNDDALAAVRGLTIGFVFQGFNLLPRATALENVELPLLYTRAGLRAGQRRRMAFEALERVGLAGRAGHVPSRLSGGQQQRVAIARAIINRPPLVLADEPTGNVDSRTGDEIMDLFASLNRQGAALVIVTHDPGVAARCPRRIVMHDGRIVEDVRAGAAPAARAPAPAGSPGSPGGAGAAEPRRLGFLDSTRTALRELRRNRLRSALTTMGIVIGVGAIVTMVGIGNGTTARVAAQVADLGENIILVEPGSGSRGAVKLGQGTATGLSVDDAAAIASALGPGAAVSPEVYTYQQVAFRDQNWNTRIYGEGPDYFGIRRWDLAAGETFSDADLRGGAAVAVIGRTPAGRLFEDREAVGEVVRIRNVPFRVIGVLESRGHSLSGRDEDDLIIVPLTTAMNRLIGPKNPLHRINVQVDDPSALPAAQRTIADLLRHAHRLPPDGEADFEVKGQQQIEDVATGTSRTMTWLLGSLAGVSLVVGGVGIMNIMFVSVTERTREIGIRMAVGAHAKDVLRQFLVEALVLSSAGGLAGVAAGIAGSRLLSLLADWPTLVPADAALLAFLFSAGVGVFFGFHPARKASRLDPIEALRHE